MNVEFLKKEKDNITMRIDNEDATFGAALEDELWQTEGIDAASINKKHPLTGKPELNVQGKDAKKLLVEATKNLKKKIEEFEKAISKEL